MSVFGACFTSAALRATRPSDHRISLQSHDFFITFVFVIHPPPDGISVWLVLLSGASLKAFHDRVYATQASASVPLYPTPN